MSLARKMAIICLMSLMLGCSHEYGIRNVDLKNNSNYNYILLYFHKLTPGYKVIYIEKEMGLPECSDRKFGTSNNPYIRMRYKRDNMIISFDALFMSDDTLKYEYAYIGNPRLDLIESDEQEQK